MTVDDSGDALANAGTLGAVSITGLGLGFSGVSYGSVENLTVNLGSGADTFTVAGTNETTTTTVNGGGGNDTISVQSTSSSATAARTTISGGAGNDRITVGNPVPVFGTTALTVAGIQGGLTVRGDAGSDTLTIDDTADLNFTSGQLTATGLTGLGMGPGGVAYDGSVEEMKVLLGDGGAFFTVASTQATTDTTVQAGANNYLIGIGSGGNVTGIAGPLTISNEVGLTDVFVNANGDTVGRTGTLSAATLTGLGMGPGGVTFSGISNLALNLGSGSDVLTVDQTAFPVKRAVNRAVIDAATGSIFVLGDPFVTSHGHLAKWQLFQDGAGTAGRQITPLLLEPNGAQWRVVGIGTTRTVNATGLQSFDFGLVAGSDDPSGRYFGWKDGSAAGVNNQGVPEYDDNTAKNIVWLGQRTSFAVNDSFAVVGQFPRTYSIEAFATPTARVTINAGDGADSVSVRSASAEVTVNAGAGNDVVTVGGVTAAQNIATVNRIAASVTINGDTGSDTLAVDDSGDLLANTGTLTASTVTGLGMGSELNYSGIDRLDVNLGSGVDAFTVGSTNAGTTVTVNAGGGADAVNVQATSGPTTINAGGGNDLITAGTLAPGAGGTVNAIAGPLTVNGDAGADT